MTCSNFKEQNFVKLGAVCQMAKPTCAANIRQLAENLDQFDFAPNVHTPEELGKYMICNIFLGCTVTIKQYAAPTRKRIAESS